MKRSEDSVTVRGLNLAVAVAFIGVGLVSLLRLSVERGLPIALVIAGLIAVVSLVVRAERDSGDFAVGALVLPLAFFGFGFVALYASTRPALGGVLVVLGPLVYLGLTFLRSRVRARATT